MQYVLWMFACLIGYGAGLFILWKVTPLIIVRAYDEGLFMAIMALDIFGGIFVFGAVAITFALFSGNIPIRTLDFLLLVGILIMGASMSFRSFRPYRVVGTNLCFAHRSRSLLPGSGSGRDLLSCPPLFASKSDVVR